MHINRLPLIILLLISATIVTSAEILRVVTINVWSGLDYKGTLKMGEYQDEETRSSRTNNLVVQLKELDPDVIAVNEANMLPRYARSLASMLEYDQIYHVGLGGLRIGALGLPSNLREGDVILAKKPRLLKKSGRKLLYGGPVGNCFSFHFTDATQIIAGRITVGGTVVFIFNTHWHASPFPSKEYFGGLAARLDSGVINQIQYEELTAKSLEGQEWRVSDAYKSIAFIEKVAQDHPVILLGDFNATADSKEIGVLLNAGFRDAFAETGDLPGYTWNGAVNTNIQLQAQVYPEDFWLEPTKRRIDYVFYRGPGLEIQKSEIVLDRESDGIHTSDHFGVLAVFDVLAEPH
jgi:hypothetical protein